MNGSFCVHTRPNVNIKLNLRSSWPCRCAVTSDNQIFGQLHILRLGKICAF